MAPPELAMMVDAFYMKDGKMWTKPWVKEFQAFLDHEEKEKEKLIEENEKLKEELKESKRKVEALEEYGEYCCTFDDFFGEQVDDWLMEIWKELDLDDYHFKPVDGWRERWETVCAPFGGVDDVYNDKKEGRSCVDRFEDIDYMTSKEMDELEEKIKNDKK